LRASRGRIDFRGRVAFLDLGGRQTAWTGDRTEVLGRNGTLDHPTRLERGERLSGRVGGGLDPAARCRVTITLAAEPSRRSWSSSARERRPTRRARWCSATAGRSGRALRAVDHALGRLLARSR
jgi:cyclic beta-1,2-glucan synthetase